MLDKFETIKWNDSKNIRYACEHIADPEFASTTIIGLDATGCQRCHTWFNDWEPPVIGEKVAQAPTKPTEANKEIAIEKLFPHLLEEME